MQSILWLERSSTSVLKSELEVRRAQIDVELAGIREREESQLSELQTEREAAESAIEGLETELSDLIGRTIAGGVPRLAEHVLTRVLVGPRAAIRQAPAATGSDSDVGSEEAFQPLRTPEDLRNAISASAIADGLDPVVSLLAGGLALGRQCILLAGTAAAALAASLAATLGGSRTFRVPIAPTMFSLGDLLSAPAAGIGGSAPVATLGSVLTLGAQEQKTSVVIMQGCNRAPPEGILSDMLELVTRRREELHFWTDGSGSPKRARIGVRTIVIGTLVEGATTFRLPEALAARLPIIDADRTVLELSSSPGGARVDPTEMDGALWELLDTGEAGVTEEVRRLRTLHRALDPEWVLQRYFSRTSHILAGLDSRFETFAALVLGRPAYADDQLNAELRRIAPPGLDIDAAHRRLATFIERSAGP